MANKRSDLTGKKYGKWTVLFDTGENTTSGRSIWMCRCECGTERGVDSCRLSGGRTNSCGCMLGKSPRLSDADKHQKFHSPTYYSWTAMRSRCNHPNQKLWHRYGGRGISYCSRWESFENFVEDMGERPEGHTLDRINNDGDYCKENCRWATPSQQILNNSRAVRFMFNGQVRTISEIAKLAGVAEGTLRDRLKINRMTLHEAVSLPPRVKIPATCGDYI